MNDNTDVAESGEDDGTRALARAIWTASHKSSDLNMKDAAVRKEAWTKDRRDMMKLAKATRRALEKNGYDMVAKPK